MTRDDLYGYYRQHYVPNNATLVIVGDVDADAGAAKCGASVRRYSAGPGVEAALYARAAAAWRAAADDFEGGDDRVSEGRVPRARGSRLGVFRAARARQRADGREGPESVGQLSHAAAPAQRAPLQGVGEYRPGVGRQWRIGADTGPVPLHDFSDRDTGNQSGRPRRRRRYAALEAVRANGITAHELAKAKTQLRARLVFEQDSVSNIAHQLGFFETIASWRYLPSIAVEDRVR